MGKIQDIYDARVKSMLPAERLELAKLILDDLARSDTSVDVRDEWGNDDLSEVAANIRSPRLARTEQLGDFVKQLVEP